MRSFYFSADLGYSLALLFTGQLSGHQRRKGVLGTDLLRLFPLMQVRDRCTMRSSESEPHVSAFECLSVS